MKTHNLRWPVPTVAAPFALEELDKAWKRHGFSIRHHDGGEDMTNIVITVPISNAEDLKQKQKSFDQLVEAIIVIGSHRDPEMFS